MNAHALINQAVVAERALRMDRVVDPLALLAPGRLIVE